MVIDVEKTINATLEYIIFLNNTKNDADSDFLEINDRDVSNSGLSAGNFYGSLVELKIRNIIDEIKIITDYREPRDDFQVVIFFTIKLGKRLQKPISNKKKVVKKISFQNNGISGKFIINKKDVISIKNIRGKSWQRFILNLDGMPTEYDKSYYNYFNSSNKNPLRINLCNLGYDIIKLLVKNGDNIFLNEDINGEVLKRQ